MPRRAVQQWAPGRARVEIAADLGSGEGQARLTALGFIDEGGDGYTRRYAAGRGHTPLVLPPGFRVASLAETHDDGALRSRRDRR